MSGEQRSARLHAKLVRMVLRVSPHLEEHLRAIHERLLEETQLDYSAAAIVRGLIALGLASIADMTTLAAAFNGTRIPRGRKRGDRGRPIDFVER